MLLQQKALNYAAEHADLRYHEYDLTGMNTGSKWIKELCHDKRFHLDDLEVLKKQIEKIFEGVPDLSWDMRIKNQETGIYEWRHIHATVKLIKGYFPKRVFITSQLIFSFQQLESRFMNTLMENGIWSWEYDVATHRIINYNPEGFVTPMGILENEFLNVPRDLIDNQFVHPDSVEVYENMYRRLAQGETVIKEKIKMWNAKLEQYRWSETVFHGIYDASGTLIRALCSCRDIEEQIQLEQQYEDEIAYRQQSSASVLIRSSINLTQNEVYEMFLNGQDMLGNKETDWMDYKKQMEVVLKDIELSEEENRQLSPSYLYEQYQKGVRNFSKEYMAKYKANGEVVWIRMECIIARHPHSGDVLANFYNYDATMEYISERVADSLMKFDYEVAGLIFVDNGSFRGFYKDLLTKEIRYKKMDYKRTMEPFLQQKIDPGCSDDLVQNIVYLTSIENVIEQLQKKKTYSVECDMLETDHTLRKKQIRFSYAGYSDNILIVTRKDIEDIVEEEKKIQEGLTKALDAAERANNAKSEFLASMSHEIRTPMNVVVGLTTLAMEEKVESPKVQDYLEQIQVASQHLLRLINDVLDMSKVESGEFELHPEVCTYKEFQESLEAIVFPLGKSKNIHFIQSGQIQGHAPVCIDRTRLNQIFYNLISNAIKFSEQDGEIHLIYNNEVKKEYIKAEFIVMDQGIGMSDEFQEQMFKPFTQEKRKATGAIEGTGLGLSIVKSIIEKMDGSIRVESQLNVGTSFIIHMNLPLAKEMKQCHCEQEIKNQSLKGKRVLVVEDHPMNQLIMTRILAKEDIETEVAEDGVCGVEQFRKSEEGYFDAVIMDIRMPKMDGLEATKKIRQLPRKDARTIPIIAMTANAYDEDRQKSKEAGMNVHLAKPIDRDKLIKTLLAFWKEEEY